MCDVLDVHPSGFYAWRADPLSELAKENQATVLNIKQSWIESVAVYGYRKVHGDLREQGIRCGQQRVRRLMKADGLRFQTGYGRRPKPHAGSAHLAVPNVLDRQF
jgi:putative transposase